MVPRGTGNGDAGSFAAAPAPFPIASCSSVQRRGSVSRERVEDCHGAVRQGHGWLGHGGRPVLAERPILSTTPFKSLAERKGEARVRTPIVLHLALCSSEGLRPKYRPPVPGLIPRIISHPRERTGFELAPISQRPDEQLLRVLGGGLMTCGRCPRAVYIFIEPFTRQP